jgi:hypothetical protein
MEIGVLRGVVKLMIARSVGAAGGGMTLATKLVEALNPKELVTVIVICDVPT